MGRNKTLSESIADKIKGKIITGEFPVGTQLPNEQELSATLNVSRTTIREAVKLLVSSHVLDIERGRGTFVATIPGLGDDPLGLDFIPEETLRADLCVFRSSIEPEVCALAAKHASKSQLAQMKKLVGRMEQLMNKVGEPPYDAALIDAYTDTEIQFHSLVYKMTHNVVFERMSNIVARSVVISYTTLLYREGFDLIENTKTHLDLYEAIVDRDEKRARDLGRIHMQDFMLAL